MHKNFGDWYRLVAIEPDGTKLAKRWAGAKAWAAAFRGSDENTLETVRIFRGLQSKTSRDPFLAAFRKQDPAFPQRNELELQVLAGASLVECVSGVGKNGEGLRSALIVGAALESSKLRAIDPRLDEIAEEVSAGLRAIAIKQRKRRLLYPENVLAETKDWGDTIKQISSAPNIETLKVSIAPIFEAFTNAFESVAEELRDTKHNLRCADEETNILWWIEGRSSRDLNKPWAMIKDATPVIAGVELADLTDVALGPLEASAHLARVLTEANGQDWDRTADLEHYLLALPNEWTMQRAPKFSEGALDIMPLSCATSLRAKSDATSWQQFFQSTTGLKLSTPLSASRISCQAYFEAVLMRILTKDDQEA